MNISVSIVITSYNYAEYLEQSILSALNQQTYPDEILIIDDASTDGSQNIIKKFETNRNIKCIYRKKNKGILFNINEGLRIAKGDFILFLAADDFLEDEILQRYREYISQHPSIGFCCGLSDKLTVASNKIELNKIPMTIPTGYLSPVKARNLIYKYGPWFAGNTVLINKRKAIDIGGYDDSLLSYTDGFLYLNLAIRHGIVFINKKLSTYRKHKNSFSEITSKDPSKLSLIEQKVLAYMNSNPENFSHAFKKRWLNRWSYIKFTAQYISTRQASIPTKFILSSFGFLRYRWFDIFNLRLLDFKNFFNEVKNHKL